MNHDKEYYDQRYKFLLNEVERKLKLERDEWIISKKAALDHFLGRDQLEELNRQPAYWPMSEGPTDILRNYGDGDQVEAWPWELQGVGYGITGHYDKPEGIR